MHTEIESVYYADKKDIVEVSKRYSVEPGDNQPISVAYQFEKLSKEIGWDWYGAGKVMGLAQYKAYEDQLEEKWLKHLDKCHEVQRYARRSNQFIKRTFRSMVRKISKCLVDMD